MSLIDAPSPVFSNVAMFKPTMQFPNGRGSTRRVNVPENEIRALGLKVGDKVSVDMYDDVSGKEVSFDIELKRGGGSESNLRFTMPLRRLNLQDNEFTPESIPQVVLRKTGLLKRLPNISPKRLHSRAIYKREPATEPNKNKTDLDSNLGVSIPREQVKTAGIEAGESLNVVLVRINEDEGALDSLSELIGSVNRSVFRTNAVETGTGVFRFNLPAERRRVKNYDINELYQVIIL